MTEVLILRMWMKDRPLPIFNPQKNGNWVCAFGGGKHDRVITDGAERPAYSGKKVYEYRQPINVLIMEDIYEDG